MTAQVMKSADFSLPAPLRVGGVGEGPSVVTRTTPTLDPSPQGGGKDDCKFGGRQA